MFIFQISKVLCAYTLYTVHTVTCIIMELHNLYNLQKTDLHWIIELHDSEFQLLLVNKAEIPIWVTLGETRNLIRFPRTQGSTRYSWPWGNLLLCHLEAGKRQKLLDLYREIKILADQCKSVWEGLYSWRASEKLNLCCVKVLACLTK